jgi:hypothetical protein
MVKGLELHKTSSGERGRGWFDEHLRRVVGDGKNTSFWNDQWVDGDTLSSLFQRLYDISLDKEACVAEMIVEEEGVKKINWRWRRRLFQWEEEMVEICSGLVLEIKRTESDGDCWRWGKGHYSVKDAYFLISEGEEEEECDWVKDVWNQFIPSNMSILVWRLFNERLPTKANLSKRGIRLNSSALCVGGCGSQETEEHLFFNCPSLGAIWREIVRWIGILVALAKGGADHLIIFKNLLLGNVKTRDRMGVIWCAAVKLIWQTRNNIVFNQTSFDWERVMEEIKIRSWNILKARSK